MSVTTLSLRWWIEDGTEECGFCSRSHSWEEHCYCWSCDGAVCVLCVVRRGPQKRILCPGCAEKEAG